MTNFLLYMQRYDELQEYLNSADFFQDEKFEY